jgi:hypothetical protein
MAGVPRCCHLLRHGQGSSFRVLLQASATVVGKFDLSRSEQTKLHDIAPDLLDVSWSPKA